AGGPRCCGGGGRGSPEDRLSFGVSAPPPGGVGGGGGGGDPAGGGVAEGLGGGPRPLPPLCALPGRRRAPHRDARQGRQRRHHHHALRLPDRGRGVVDLTAYLDARRATVDAALDRVLPPETAEPVTIHRAMRYSVLAPGKRLRPILAIAGAEAVGGRADAVLDTACALELIHAYSLIHDDLPAMDDDDYRRGRLTSHKVFGEAMAILAGDALLTLAFRLVATNAGRVAPPALVGSIVAEVADAAGTEGMV